MGKRQIVRFLRMDESKNRLGDGMQSAGCGVTVNGNGAKNLREGFDRANAAVHAQNAPIDECGDWQAVKQTLEGGKHLVCECE